MKILFWVPYPTEGASNRLRVEQYLPYLEKAGVQYRIHPFWSSSAFAILYKRGYFLRKTCFLIWGVLFRLIDILSIYKYDIVFIHRQSLPVFGYFLESILCIFKKPIVFDFDDAIFLPSTSKPNSFIERFKNYDKVSKIIRKSRHVISGNRYLADFALRFNPSVSVIPTAIDTDKYFPYPKDNNKELVIGWIGSITTLDFLKDIENVFTELSKRYPNILFKIIGGEFFIRGVANIVSRPWSLDREIEDLKSLDIGIMPIPDNEWVKGKCGFKAILYMSMGIPCVCSSAGVNKEIVSDGINGFLADQYGEWIKKLSFLIESSELRRKMGLAGRKSVEERYSVRANAPQFLRILQKVYKESKVKA